MVRMLISIMRGPHHDGIDRVIIAVAVVVGVFLFTGRRSHHHSLGSTASGGRGRLG